MVPPTCKYQDCEVINWQIQSEQDVTAEESYKFYQGLWAWMVPAESNRV